MIQIVAGFFGLQLHAEPHNIKGRKSEGVRDGNKVDWRTSTGASN